MLEFLDVVVYTYVQNATKKIVIMAVWLFVRGISE